MAQTTTVPGLSSGTSPRQPYTLYATKGRVYCSNVDQKLVDLGELVRATDGWRYWLDGNQLTGHGLPDEEAAMRQIGERIGFFWLDGQFTALVDMRGQDGLNLDGVPRIDITLHTPQPGERMVDASV